MGETSPLAWGLEVGLGPWGAEWETLEAKHDTQAHWASSESLSPRSKVGADHN